MIFLNKYFKDLLLLFVFKLEKEEEP